MFKKNYTFQLRNRTSIVKWNLFMHYFSIVFAIINGLVLVPFYLKFIDSTLFGAWLATGNILVWLTIIEPGVGDVLQQKISAALGENNIEKVGQYISSGILISIVVSIIVLILSLIFKYFIVEIIDLPKSLDVKQLIEAFQLTAIGSAFVMLGFCFVGSNQGLQSSLGITLIHIVVNLVAIILNFILLFKGFGLLSIAYANLLRGLGISVSNAIYMFYRLNRLKIKLLFSKTFFFDFSKLFTYTFFNKISSTIVNNVDLIIIARFVNPEAVTMLELTRRPIRIAQGFTDRISVAFMGPLAHLQGEGNFDRIKAIFKRFIYIYSWMSVLIIIGFIALNEQLLHIWAGSSIFIGNKINILLSITLWISSLAYNFSNFNYALGNIKGNSKISIIKSMVYVIFIFAFAYLWGVIGVVLATLVSVLATEFWYHPIKLNKQLQFTKIETNNFLVEIIKLAVIGISIVIFVFYFLPKTSNWFSLSINAFNIAIFFFVFTYLLSLSFRKEVKKTMSYLFLKCNLKKSSL